MLRRIHRSEHGLIVNWLVRLVLGLAITAVVLFDAGAILVNTFTLDSKADEIAIALTTGVQLSTVNAVQLEQDARTMAKEAGARLVGFSYDPATRVVKVKLRRTADTLVVRRLSFTKGWGRATGEGQAGIT